MPADLTDQLSAYGDWIERESATSMIAPERPDPTTDAGRDRAGADTAHGATPLPQRTRPAWLLVAAAALVVVGVAGLLLASRSDEPTGTDIVDTPDTGPSGIDDVVEPDAIGPAFLLPRGAEDLYLDNGEVRSPRPAADGGPVMVVGRPDGDGFVDLTVVPIDSELPSEVDVGPDFEIIATLTADTLGPRGGSTAVLNGAERSVDFNDHVVVQTIQGESAIGSVRIFDRIEPTRVRGVPAWLATQEDADRGTSYALLWRETPSYVGAISGFDLEEISEVAEGLESVEESEWKRIVRTRRPFYGQADQEAYCAVAAELAVERAETYVGSDEHLADLEALLQVTSAQIRLQIEAVRDYVASGAIDAAADPDSTLTSAWPEDVRSAIDEIVTFDAESCQ